MTQRRQQWLSKVIASDGCGGPLNTRAGRLYRRELLLKLRALSAAGDQTRFLPPSARLQPEDTEALNIWLRNSSETIPHLVGDAALRDPARVGSLHDLVKWVRKHEFSSITAIDWPVFTAVFNSLGSRVPLIVLARRWYELCRQTRRRLRAIVRCRAGPPPAPIHLVLARLLPEVVVGPPQPHWSQVAASLPLIPDKKRGGSHSNKIKSCSGDVRNYMLRWAQNHLLLLDGVDPTSMATVSYEFSDSETEEEPAKKRKEEVIVDDDEPTVDEKLTMNCVVVLHKLEEGCKSAGGPDQPQQNMGGPDRQLQMMGGPDRPLRIMGYRRRSQKRIAGPDQPQQKTGGPDRPWQRLGGPYRPQQKTGGPDRPQQRMGGGNTEDDSDVPLTEDEASTDCGSSSEGEMSSDALSEAIRREQLRYEALRGKFCCNARSKRAHYDAQHRRRQNGQPILPLKVNVDGCPLCVRDLQRGLGNVLERLERVENRLDDELGPDLSRRASGSSSVSKLSRKSKKRKAKSGTSSSPSFTYKRIDYAEWLRQRQSVDKYFKLAKLKPAPPRPPPPPPPPLKAPVKASDSSDDDVIFVEEKPLNRSLLIKQVGPENVVGLQLNSAEKVKPVVGRVAPQVRDPGPPPLLKLRNDSLVVSPGALSNSGLVLTLDATKYSGSQLLRVMVSNNTAQVLMGGDNKPPVASTIQKKAPLRDPPALIPLKPEKHRVDIIKKEVSDTIPL